jgi:hypothetical protein
VRGLLPTEILALWDMGPSPGSAAAALSLLGFARPDLTEEERRILPIGRRDRLIMDLRRRTLGPRLEARASCPACAEPLELPLSLDELDLGAVPEGEGGEVVAIDDFTVRFRLPGTADVEAALGSRDPRRALIERCVTAVDRAGQRSTASEIPAAALDAIAGRMADLDPQADVEIALACPACAHRWTASFDIASFFLRELDAWGARLLREVHTLAKVHGWSEAEILGMSARRRQGYLEMIDA